MPLKALNFKIDLKYQEVGNKKAGFHLLFNSSRDLH